MTADFRFESSFEVEIDDRHMAVANVMQELPYSSAWRCRVNPTLLMVGIWKWKRTERMGKTLSTLRRLLGLASDPNRDAYLCEKYRKHRQQYRVILSNEYSEVVTASMKTYGWHTCWDIDGAYRKSCLITAEYLRDYCIVAKVYDENNHFIFRRLYWRKSDEQGNVFVVPSSRAYSSSGIPDSIKKECHRIVKEALGLQESHQWNRREFNKTRTNYLLYETVYFDLLSDYVLHPVGVKNVPNFYFEDMFREKEVTEDSEVRCDSCGEYESVDSRGVCEDCGGGRHICVCCGESIRPEYWYITESGDYICEDCYCSNYSTCSCCEEIYHNDYMTYIDGTDEYVCDHCRDRKYEYCRGCDEWHLSSSMEDTADGYRCESCIEKDYHMCDGCGECVRDITNTEDGKDICNSCLEEDYDKCDECGLYYQKGEAKWIELSCYCPDCHEDNTSNEEDDVEIEWTEKV